MRMRTREAFALPDSPIHGSVFAVVKFRIRADKEDLDLVRDKGLLCNMIGKRDFMEKGR